MNRSEHVLERNLGRAARLFRDGAMVYKAIRNGLITFGVTASVLLPLASPTTQQPTQQPTSPTTVTVLPNVPVVVHNEINPGAPPLPRGDTPRIEVAVLTSPIQGAPPISRAWHRTTFSRTGDEFWALPDAEFKLRFIRGADFTGCNNREPAGDAAGGDAPSTCQGSFALTTDAGVSFDIRTVPGRGLAFVDDPVPSGCTVHRAPAALTPTAVCEISRTSGANLCIWLRRSEHPESKRYTRQGREVVDWLEETVALDVRWKPVEPDDECLALLPD